VPAQAKGASAPIEQALLSSSSQAAIPQRLNIERNDHEPSALTANRDDARKRPTSREDRLAAALRANLKRRKTTARSQPAEPQPDAGAKSDSET
jgi:hypothetical protein